MQRHLNQLKLLDRYEVESIKICNHIGVNINKVFDKPHLCSTLSFISGLGNKKSINLIKKIKSVNGLTNRIQILENNLLDKVVFNNCSPFLIIKSYNEYAYEIEKINLLDTTRICPDFYALTNKICNSAVEYSKLVQNYGSKKKTSNSSGLSDVETSMKNPELFNRLDLEDFIKTLEDNGSYNMRPIFKLIINELQNPYKTTLQPLPDIKPVDLFYFLINESKDSFQIGSTILVRVDNYGDNDMNCKLANELLGSIPINEMLEEEQCNIVDLKKKYHKHFSFQAKVKNINFNKLRVELTAKKTELISNRSVINKTEIGKYMKLTEDDFINHVYIADKEGFNKLINEVRKKNAHYIECSCKEAIEILSERKIGNYIFRPKRQTMLKDEPILSISDNYNNTDREITLTWKFYNNLYMHENIIEEINKLNSVCYYIGNKKFESLEEIEDKYIGKICSYIKEVITHRKFVEATKFEDLEKKLKDDKAINPNTSFHYCYSILPEYNTRILLVYLLTNQVLIEEIKVKQTGFVLQGKIFQKLDKAKEIFKSYLVSVGKLPKEFKEPKDNREHTEHREHKDKRIKIEKSSIKTEDKESNSLNINNISCLSNISSFNEPFSQIKKEIIDNKEKEIKFTKMKRERPESLAVIDRKNTVKTGKPINNINNNHIDDIKMIETDGVKKQKLNSSFEFTNINPIIKNNNSNNIGNSFISLKSELSFNNDPIELDKEDNDNSINISQNIYSQLNPIVKSESFVSSIQNIKNRNSQIECPIEYGNILDNLKKEDMVGAGVGVSGVSGGSEVAAPKCFKCQEEGHCSKDCATSLSKIYKKNSNKKEKK